MFLIYLSVVTVNPLKPIFICFHRSVLYHIDTSEPCMPPVPVKVDLPSIIKIRDVSS